MMKSFLIAALLAATLGAAPTPQPSAAPQKTATVDCEVTLLYYWPKSEGSPRRAGETQRVSIGQSFPIVSGPRTSLGGDNFYELDIPTVETGNGTKEHYWIWQQCVSVN